MSKLKIIYKKVMNFSTCFVIIFLLILYWNLSLLLLLWLLWLLWLLLLLWRFLD